VLRLSRAKSLRSGTGGDFSVAAASGAWESGKNGVAEERQAGAEDGCDQNVAQEMHTEEDAGDGDADGTEEQGWQEDREEGAERNCYGESSDRVAGRK
jgi:hypothetical protein